MIKLENVEEEKSLSEEEGNRQEEDDDDDDDEDNDDGEKVAGKATSRHLTSHLREVPEAAIDCFARRALKSWTDVKNATMKYPAGPVVFVTADSSRMARRVMQVISEAGVRVFSSEKYGGKVRHIDKSTKDQTRTFLDWFLLSRMDRLVISQSGFSESAGKFSCSPASIFHNIPNMPAFNNFSTCDAHFYDMQETGLCHPSTDREPANLYLSRLYEKNKN